MGFSVHMPGKMSHWSCQFTYPFSFWPKRPKVLLFYLPIKKNFGMIFIGSIQVTFFTPVLITVTRRMHYCMCQAWVKCPVRGLGDRYCAFLPEECYEWNGGLKEVWVQYTQKRYPLQWTFRLFPVDFSVNSFIFTSDESSYLRILVWNERILACNYYKDLKVHFCGEELVT